MSSSSSSRMEAFDWSEVCSSLLAIEWQQWHCVYSSSCTVAVAIRSSQLWPRPCMHACCAAGLLASSGCCAAAILGCRVALPGQAGVCGT